MPSGSLSIRGEVEQVQVMNVVLRFVKSLPGPPEPGSRWEGPVPPANPACIGLRRNGVSEVLQLYKMFIARA